MSHNQYDAVVIGGGPGGYVAAIHLAKLGGKVAIIEKDRLGGTCLNRGCIPTKAFYHYAKLMYESNHMNDLGLKSESVSVDMASVSARKNQIVNELVDGVATLLEKTKSNYLEGMDVSCPQPL